MRTGGALWAAMARQGVPAAGVTHASMQALAPPGPQQQADGAALLAMMQQCHQQQQAAAHMAYQQAAMQGAPVHPAAMVHPYHATPQHQPGFVQGSAAVHAGWCPQPTPGMPAAGAGVWVPHPQAVMQGAPVLPAAMATPITAAHQHQAGFVQGTAAGHAGWCPQAMPGMPVAAAGPGLPHPQATSAAAAHPTAQPAVDPACLAGALQQVHAALPQQAAAGLPVAGAAPGVSQPQAAGAAAAQHAGQHAVGPAHLADALQQVLHAALPQQAPAGAPVAAASPGLHPGAAGAHSFASLAAAAAAHVGAQQAAAGVKPEGRRGRRGGGAAPSVPGRVRGAAAVPRRGWGAA